MDEANRNCSHGYEIVNLSREQSAYHGTTMGTRSNLIVRCKWPQEN